MTGLGADSRRGGGLALLGIVILGLAIRVLLPWPAVVTREGILPPGGADEFYHLRRIEYSVERFPAVLERDPTVDYPETGEIVWPPLWDWAIAAIALPLGASGDRGRLEAVVAAVPPLVGIATLLMVFWIGLRHFGAPAGLAAAALLAILPAHSLSSRLAKSDHHVGATLATTWLLSAGMRWLDGFGRPSDAQRLRLSAELGLALAVVLLVWTGALLHVGILLATAATAVLTLRDRGCAAARARELALACAVAAIGIAPFSLGTTWREYGSFSPLVLSSFQPVLFGAGALVLGLCALAWPRFGFGRACAGRAGFGLALGAGGLVAVFLVVPELGPALATGAGWFQESEDFQSRVLELRSMWTATGRFAVGVPQLLFTDLIGLAVPLAVWLAWRAIRGGEGRGAWLLLAWAVAFFAASSSQIRFSNELAVPLALLGGFWIARTPGPQRRSAAAALALCALSTSIAVYAGPIADWHRVSAGERPARLGVDEREVTLVPFARWLGEHTPATAGWLDPTATPAYGVLTPWGQGHLVRYYARRAMVQDNFGVYGGRASYEAAERYYGAEDEDLALRELHALGVRYVLASPEGSGHGGPYSPLSMTQRLARYRGTAATDRLDGRAVRVPALVHHRLLNEVDWTRGIDEAPRTPGERAAAAFRWYEVVEGARVRGRARPGSAIRAELRLRSGSGREIAYASEARADSGGRYVLTLPYPTDAASGVYRPLGPYSIWSARARAALDVSEEDVRSGGSVRGPALDGGAR